MNTGPEQASPSHLIQQVQQRVSILAQAGGEHNHLQRSKGGAMTSDKPRLCRKSHATPAPVSLHTILLRLMTPPPGRHPSPTHLKPLAHGAQEVVHKRPLQHVHVYYPPLQAPGSENHAQMCRSFAASTRAVSQRPTGQKAAGPCAGNAGMPLPLTGEAAPQSLLG